MGLVATILDDTVVYFWSPFLPADVLHPLNTLCACMSQYLPREETNITDVRWSLAQVPRLAVTEVPWWRHAYRPFHTALLDVISTTTKASCMYEFFFFLSISLSLWSQNLSCPLKVLCGLVSKRVGYVWYFLLPMIFILWVYISMNCFSKLHCV